MPKIPIMPEPPDKAFDLATPAHVYSKLLWELGNLKRSMAEEAAEDAGLRFESAYHAYNLAVTAWHLVDWVWAASDNDTCKYISKFFGGVEMAKKAHLYNAVAQKYRAIHICGQIANGSKHYIAAWGDDPSVKAMVLWVKREPVEGTDDRVRFLFQKELAIRDGDDDPRPAIDIFKGAVKAWDGMLGNWGFIEDRYIGPDTDPPPWV
ncbi:MAG: hypothetical protein WCA78_07760 [Rhizomicrobium sp.]